MNVTLKTLKIQNFKGIKNLSIDFGQNTTISGANGLGKTTVFDAFTWALFGKDSTDRKDFNIKSLDADSRTNRHLITEVVAIIMTDDRTTTIRKTYSEKWTKKRGEELEEYTGNETLYYWNDVPMTQRDFQTKVENIIPETLFKLITSPSYFNSLKKEERRAVLINLAGTISDTDIAKGNENFELLLEQLSGKTLIEYKKELSTKRLKLKNDISVIPPKIEELSRNVQVEIDYEISDKIKTKKAEIKEVEAEMIDASKGNEIENQAKIELQNKKFKLQSEINNKSNEIKAERAKKETVNSGLFSELEALTLEQGRAFKTIEQNENLINITQKEVVELRELFAKINSSEIRFDEIDFVCPTCGRGQEPENIEAKKVEMQENFNLDKSRKLAEINTKGKLKNSTIEDYTALKTKAENRNSIIEADIIALKAKIENNKNAELQPISEIIESNQFVIDCKAKIAEIEYSLENRPNQNNEIRLILINRKQILETELQGLIKIETLQNVAENTVSRIAELKMEEQKLNSQLSAFEKMEFIATEFSKAKMSIVEKTVNDKFTIVKFRLFETQINGGELDVCDCLINGVPYPDANNASKINAGIDIINTLCEFNAISAPIFCDNAEAVNNLLPTLSQTVSLVVSTDKVLKIT